MDDDGDDKDDTKRKSRNLSEKKRRDQFNMLINELSSMVSNTSRKMDKSTVLKSTISFLRNHNELSVRSRAHEIQEDWKPSFLSNEEFTHIILESVDGFIIVFSLSGHIMYASGSITSLLGHLPSDLMNGPMTVFDLVCEEDHHTLYDILGACRNGNSGKDNQLHFSVHVRRGTLDLSQEPVYDLVHFVGYFRGEAETADSDNGVSSSDVNNLEADSGLVFVGTGRLDSPHLISEMTFTCESVKSEFTSRHNLDWKFLALDARATPIIGYVQLEVVGTSGYDYYHVDDLDKIVSCHEALMEKGEGTSCYYRFLTKGQQWVWLQTRYYISYHQWNSKPEFVVCTHRVISYVDVLIHSRKQNRKGDESQDDASDMGPCDKRHGSSRLSAASCSNQSSKDGSANTFMSLLSSDDSRSPRRYRGETVASSCQRAPSSEHGRHGSSSVRSFQEMRSVRSVSPTMSEESYASRTSHMSSQRSVRTQPTSRHPHPPKSSCPLSPAQATSTYVEPPPPQYVAAIPLQPILTGFPPVGALPQQELMPQPQSPLSDQVKRKQLELHQLRQLMCQKEEELQQFVMAQSRYGLIPSLLNVSVPLPAHGSAVSSTTHQSSPLAVLPVAPSMPAPRPYQVSASSSNDPQQNRLAGNLTEQEFIPYQYVQPQSQLIFHTNVSPEQQPRTPK